MSLLFLQLLSLLVISGWARDLHEARVVLVEKELPSNDGVIDRREDGVIVERSEEEERLFPAYLPLEVHADGKHVASLMLQRSADLDEGFTIESADGEFEAIPAQRMMDAAMYRDPSSWAVFGVKRDENGLREYEGSFEVDGQYYFMGREGENKRSDGEYKMTRMERKEFSNDALHFSHEDLERTNPKFDKRATNYNVEIGVLIDYSEYKFWLDREGSQRNALNKINYKMTYMLNAMRMSYKTVSGMTITPYFTKFSVNTDSSKSLLENPNAKYYNSAKYYLDKWGKAAPNNGMAAGSDVDIGMWWAKYDICGESNCDTIGLAWLDGVCSSVNGYNIIEDTGFDTWQTAAHELAHNLGAKHDGKDNSCSGNDHYVMSPSAGWPPAGSGHTGYDFSSCSNNYMTKLLASKSCLSNGARDGFTKVNGGLPGAEFSVDEQCQLLHGSTSGECTFVPADAARCREGIWCTDPQKPNSCTKLGKMPWEGTPCGGGKHCFNAECVN